jgi:hypothetical protein
MSETFRKNLESFGISLRFLTPILIAIVGYFTIQTLSSIDNKFEKIDNKFNMFLTTYHEMDKRVDRLEYKSAGN